MGRLLWDISYVFLLFLTAAPGVGVSTLITRDAIPRKHCHCLGTVALISDSMEGAQSIAQSRCSLNPMSSPLSRGVPWSGESGGSSFG